MTAKAFRTLALRLRGAVESAHMDHPDFRIGGKVFATIGHPNSAHAMVKLTPTQQTSFIKAAPKVFTPASGAWGRGGSTIILLSLARAADVRPALAKAHANLKAK